MDKLDAFIGLSSWHRGVLHVVNTSARDRRRGPELLGCQSFYSRAGHASKRSQTRHANNHFRPNSIGASVCPSEPCRYISACPALPSLYGIIPLTVYNACPIVQGPEGGSWWRPPMSPIDFKKFEWQCPLLLFFPVDLEIVQRRLSILRSGIVHCRYLLNVPVDFEIVQRPLSSLRNGVPWWGDPNIACWLKRNGTVHCRNFLR